MRLSNFLLASIGFVSGVSLQLNRLPYGTPELSRARLTTLALPVVLSGLVLTAILFCGRWAARRFVAHSSLADSVKARYHAYDTFCYLPFLVFCLGAVGLRFPIITAVLLLGMAVLFAQAVLIYSLLDTPARTHLFSSFQWLTFLFFLSGFAALIYQIVWQRVLFGLFGVNVESVTITVSLFMFGLGLGSLAGGFLSKRFPAHAPQLFLLCEFGIGMFGLVSIPLIERVGELTLHGSPLTVSLATYALLSLPTLGMGATLPILVGYLNRYYDNVGKSVGVLYFINTIGSAVACFLTADVLFKFFGLQAAVLVAAICNFLVAVLIYNYCRRLVRVEATATPKTPFLSHPETEYRRFFLALFLSAITGYISLSQEILWFRAISYIMAGRPNVFAYLLGFFLFGIALGALLAKRVCETGKNFVLPFITLMLILTGVCYDFSLPLCANVLTLSPDLGLGTCYLAVTVISLLLGSVFPVACHYGIDGKSSPGFSLSLVYFVNILGATVGPLLTGFILLEHFSLEQSFFFVSTGTLVLAAVVGLAGFQQGIYRLGGCIAAALVSWFLFLAHDGLYNHVLEKMQFKNFYAQRPLYKDVIQNRSGIIAVAPGDPDAIFGGGSYDGRFCIDPVTNSNAIRRAYMMAALHPNPEQVLEIGLSSGSWARVLADHEKVRRLTSIEINPGYLGILDNYPDIASIRTDPKVTICIDDGRRWLRRNPEAKFDFILMNTTFHWRDHITNLLSVEFFQLCRSHLKPGGVLYFNTTGSEDAVFTVAKVFKHVVRYVNFAAASDTPFLMTSDEKRQNLLKFRRNGSPVLDAYIPQTRKVLEELATTETTDKAPEIRLRSDLWCITDDNMATEFKTNSPWFKPDEKWGKDFMKWLFR